MSKSVLSKEAIAAIDEVMAEYEEELVAAMRAADARVSIRIGTVERGVRVRATSRHPYFRRYCEGWLGHMLKYREGLPDDYWPFQYGERPLIGFLAASVWGARDVCIEEFAADKIAGVKEERKRTSRKRRDEVPGRGDLYFWRDDDQHGNVEFKMHNVGVSRTNRFAESLSTWWKTTEEDAERCAKDIPAFGGMFLRPYIGKSKDLTIYKENLKEILKVVWDEVEPDALAWWCPIDQVVEGVRDTKDWIVGAIMVIKKVR